MNILLSFLNLRKRNDSFYLQSPNFYALGVIKITCLIPSSRVQYRQLKAPKTLPVPVGEGHRQGMGSISDHRIHYAPLLTTRKQHGQRGAGILCFKTVFLPIHDIATSPGPTDPGRKSLYPDTGFPSAAQSRPPHASPPAGG